MDGAHCGQYGARASAARTPSGRGAARGRALPAAAEPSDDEVARIPREVLLRLVGELPDGYRTVFNLFCIEGYPHREIAAMLGINEKSSSSQLARARALLARKLRAWLDTHEL